MNKNVRTSYFRIIARNFGTIYCSLLSHPTHVYLYPSCRAHQMNKSDQLPPLRITKSGAHTKNNFDHDYCQLKSQLRTNGTYVSPLWLGHIYPYSSQGVKRACLRTLSNTWLVWYHFNVTKSGFSPNQMIRVWGALSPDFPTIGGGQNCPQNLKYWGGKI